MVGVLVLLLVTHANPSSLKIHSFLRWKGKILPSIFGRRKMFVCPSWRLCVPCDRSEVYPLGRLPQKFTRINSISVILLKKGEFLYPESWRVGPTPYHTRRPTSSENSFVFDVKRKILTSIFGGRKMFVFTPYRLRVLSDRSKVYSRRGLPQNFTRVKYIGIFSCKKKSSFHVTRGGVLDLLIVTQADESRLEIRLFLKWNEKIAFNFWMPKDVYFFSILATCPPCRHRGILSGRIAQKI